MTNFIPLFPLGIVVFPGEDLNLHIFEPKYKQLINDCFTQKKPFGIPTVLKKGIGDLGTTVQVEEIVQVYEDGKMDVRTKGLQVFRILEIVKTLPDKLYSGAIVNYPETDGTSKVLLLKRIILLLKELHDVLNVSKRFTKPDDQLLSFDIAHHAALSLEQEYDLLGLAREDQRLEYIKRHLKKILPVVNEMETLKERVKLNGHFKELKGFNLEF